MLWLTVTSYLHGMQIKGFEWKDHDMYTNSESPYFLGVWWPKNSPDFFFKTASIKDYHRQLYFDPAKRLPLYQLVFHDSVKNH